MKETAHYGLTQWVPWDRRFWERLAGDSGRLDQALAGKCRVVCGVYRGDNRSRRFISLGFTPVAVLLEELSGYRGGITQANAGLAVKGGGLISSKGTAMGIDEGGFTVFFDTDRYCAANSSTSSYQYVAFA